jgi:hypothetical protein
VPLAPAERSLPSLVALLLFHHRRLPFLDQTGDLDLDHHGHGHGHAPSQWARHRYHPLSTPAVSLSLSLSLSPSPSPSPSASLQLHSYCLTGKPVQVDQTSQSDGEGG